MRRKLVFAALIIVLVGTLGVAFKVQRVKASGTISINADGSIDPPTAPISTTDNVTYTFTGDITDNIMVLRNNIVIDGRRDLGLILHGDESGIGIHVMVVGNVTIRNTNVEDFYYGIRFEYSIDNTISGSFIFSNNIGIEIWGGENNTISGNWIIDNDVGMTVTMGQGNKFYHNNFYANTKHVEKSGLSYSSNTWDNGYPSGGNYWDNYTGLDWYSGPNQDVWNPPKLMPDAIGDTPHNITVGNIDNYPLMGRFSEYSWDTNNLHFISNSNVEEVEVHVDTKIIEFNVAGDTGTPGFCRICIPHDLMEPEYHVYIDGEPHPDFNVYEEETVSCLYFTYTHSTHQVIITPEFPSFLIIPLFMIATLAAVILHKRKLSDGKC